MKQLDGTVALDRANEDAARLNLQWTRIVAPVTGRVGLRPVDAGNFIAAGSSTGVATITQVAPIDVVFSMPQDRVPELQQRRASGATLPVDGLDRTRTRQLDAGSFSTLDNQVDTTTGTVRAKARFANAAGALFPNQFVNVRLLLRTIDAAVVVPVTALRHGPNGDFVYVVSAERDGRAAPGDARHSGVDDVAITQRAGGRRAGRDRRRRPAQGRRARADRRRPARHRPAVGAAPAAARHGTQRGPPAWRRRPLAQPADAANGHGLDGLTPRRRAADEPVAPVHPAAGRDLAADAGDRARRPRRLPLPAAVGAAAGRLPDDPGADAVPRRQPRGDGQHRHRAAGAPVRPDVGAGRA